MIASDSSNLKLGPETRSFEQKIPSSTLPEGLFFVPVRHDEVINFYFFSPKKKACRAVDKKGQNAICGHYLILVARRIYCQGT